MSDAFDAIGISFDCEVWYPTIDGESVTGTVIEKADALWEHLGRPFPNGLLEAPWTTHKVEEGGCTNCANFLLGALFINREVANGHTVDDVIGYLSADFEERMLEAFVDIEGSLRSDLDGFAKPEEEAEVDVKYKSSCMGWVISIDDVIINGSAVEKANAVFEAIAPDSDEEFTWNADDADEEKAEFDADEAILAYFLQQEMLKGTDPNEVLQDLMAAGYEEQYLDQHLAAMFAAFLTE